MSNPIFSLVIPTYKERVNIEPLLRQLGALLEGVLPGRYELIVVDDDSPDRTWEAAEEIAATMPQVHVIRRVGERGLATAVVAGWKSARGEWLGVIDADLQHPPEVILSLLSSMGKGADLAVASRHVEGGSVSEWNIFRRMLSRGAQLLGILLLPSAARAVSDPMSGYFIVRHTAVDLSQLRPLGYKILLEVLARGHFSRIEESGYVFQERREGVSKVTWRQYWEYLVQIGRLWAASWHKPRK